MKLFKIILIPIVGLCLAVVIVAFFPTAYQGYWDIRDDEIGNVMLKLAKEGILSSESGRLHPDRVLSEIEFNAILLNSLGIERPAYFEEGKYISGETIMYYLADIVRVQGEFDPVLNLFGQKEEWTRGDFAMLYHQLFDSYLDEPNHSGITVNGRAVVRAQNTVLQNMVINGDLVISGLVGDSMITLDNVWVNGRLILVDTHFEQLVFTNGTEITREIVHTK